MADDEDPPSVSGAEELGRIIIAFAGLAASVAAFVFLGLPLGDRLLELLERRSNSSETGFFGMIVWLFVIVFPSFIVYGISDHIYKKAVSRK